MKTLDEVIKALTICKNPDINRNCKDCPMPDTHECIEVLMTDALHYLKLLQKHADFVRGQLDDLKEEHRPNEPLTWEQLKQMEGKPVWVEDNIDEPEDLTKYWAIYRRIEKAQETEYALLSDFYYDKAQYGETWQAYRKERTDGLR